MKRLLASLVCDVRLQIRNGFYAASVFVIAVWAGLFSQLPRFDASGLWAGMVAGNLILTTFYFLCGLALLERDEGSLAARAVTPLRPWEYLASKAGTLTALAVAENLILTVLLAWLGFLRLDASLAPLTAGMALLSALFCLAGFIVIVRYRSINEFLMPSMLYTVALAAPLIDFFGLWRSPVFYVHPVQAVLVFMSTPAAGFTPALAAYAVLYPLAATAALFVLAARAYRALLRGAR